MYLTSISSHYSHSFVACSGTLSAFQRARSLPLAVVIFSLLLEHHQHQLKLGLVEGRTLSAPEWTKRAGYGGVCGNPSINSSMYERIFPGMPPRGQNRQDSGGKILVAKLSRDFIHVRLNIVHDKALEQEHSNNPGGLKDFLRNLMYSVQLIFEQPEMSSSLKFNLVVTSIKLSSIEYARDEYASDMLSSFERSSDVISDGSTVDVNILLVYRTLVRYLARNFRQEVLGLAQLGTFCRVQHQNDSRLMILSSSSLGSAYTFAHELGHALGVRHDGEANNCGNTNNIMNPSAGPEKLTWSTCTIEQLIQVFSLEDRAKCIYDAERIASVKPLSDDFDFNPTTEAGSLNRKKLPGEIVNIDEQCSRYGEKKARSTLNEPNQAEKRYTTCQDLICMIGRFRFPLGPAPPGSACKQVGSSKLGRCSMSRCMDT